MKKNKSELRFDFINQNWVVVAEGRAKRPESFKIKSTVLATEEQKKEQEASCVFCQIFAHPAHFEKDIIVLPNKFPAFQPSPDAQLSTKWSWLNKWRKPLAKQFAYNALKNSTGFFAPSFKQNRFFQTVPAVGFQEVIVLKEHYCQLSDLTKEQFVALLNIYQQRYENLSKMAGVNYISLFHNQGKTAGASLEHPHSQIIAIPFFDLDLQRALDSAKSFYQQHNLCLFCALNRAEKSSDKSRIIWKNKNFLAFCPFASRVNFQVVIAPQNHLPYFEKITEEEKNDLAEIFQIILLKIKKGLNNPDYNFYLKTAPCDGKEYPFFHWHFTIMPKTSVWAGFELGAGIEIITISPEKAAEYLRKQ